MRSVNVIVTALMLLAVIATANPGMFKRGDRRPPPVFWDSAQGTLPAPSGQDTKINVASSPQESGVYTGTAFSIDPRGVWLTASHVTEGCTTVLIEPYPGGGRWTTTRLFEHPRADVAII